MKIVRFWMIMTLVFFYYSSALACGQSGGTSPSNPDLSGFWQLRFDSKNIPPALLTLSAKEADPEAQYRHDLYAIRWCNHIGMPAMMETRYPLIFAKDGTKLPLLLKRFQRPVTFIWMDKGTLRWRRTIPNRMGIRLGIGKPIRWWLTQSGFPIEE